MVHVNCVRHCSYFFAKVGENVKKCRYCLLETFTYLAAWPHKYIEEYSQICKCRARVDNTGPPYCWEVISEYVNPGLLRTFSEVKIGQFPNFGCRLWGALAKKLYMLHQK